MNDEEIINKIIHISNIIDNKSIQHDVRVKLGIEALDIYEKLKNKNMLQSNIYIIYRRLGALYLESNDYMNSEKFFEKSLELKKKIDKVDSLVNECITKQMLARQKIMLYLNTNNTKKIDEANDLLKFIEDKYDENWNESLKIKINETKEIYKSVLNNNIETVVRMEIPYHMLLNESEEISFEYNNIKCKIKSETIRSQSSGFIIGDNIYTEKDKYGIVNRSIVTITIGKYINGNELVQVNKAIDRVYKPLNEAIEIYNYFLRRYIISTGKYWLPEINENMIFRFETIVLVGNIEIKNIPLSISMNILSSGDRKLTLKREEIEDIKKNLSSSNEVIWKLAINSAKDYYLIKDYKNTIIMINIALENYTYYFANNILKKFLTTKEIESFFSGDVKYEEYFLKNYIKEEDFNKAKNENVIKDNPSTIYRIYNECYKYEQFPITKTQLNKKISIIKDQRNEIVHGLKISKDLKFVAEKAIEEFENMVKVLNI